jgi:hypothetical protein
MLRQVTRFQPTLISPNEGISPETGVADMRDVNAKTFEAKVLKSILPVVVVIWGVG